MAEGETTMQRIELTFFVDTPKEAEAVLKELGLLFIEQSPKITCRGWVMERVKLPKAPGLPAERSIVRRA